ncbi:MAG: DUF1501 domain-containing protein [Planctomycetales bacterium]|nr:DUF1501 domain-containing protein [Planctomycetales bacterium]
MKCKYACNSSEHTIARRNFLGTIAAGATTMAGLGTLVQPSVAAEIAAKKKRVMSIFLSGGVSQLETFDPKPGTLNGGPFRAIPTSVPGVHICELLPKTAKQMHRMSIVRTVNTNDNDHGLSRYKIERGHKQSPTADYPHIGAIVAKGLDDGSSSLPGHIHVSNGAGSRSSNSAFLGPKYGSISVGINGGLRNSSLPGGMTATVNDQRQAFRRAANERFLQRRRTAETDAYAQSYEQALQLMAKREIFDVTKEPPKLAEQYGSFDLGKQCLLGRRLLENDISFVQVSHSNYDTHAENFNFHIEQLGEFDQAYSTLLDDLAERGMLDSTLVLVLTEFGRTPRINSKFGRDHWGKGFSITMAGCGIQPGAVIGAMSKDGTEIADREVKPADLFHTYLRAIGLDPTNEFDIGGRAVPMADPTGEAIEELLA